ncbi:MAG: hypothetical protein WCO23_02230 [bacterium]
MNRESLAELTRLTRLRLGKENKPIAFAKMPAEMALAYNEATGECVTEILTAKFYQRAEGSLIQPGAYTLVRERKRLGIAFAQILQMDIGEDFQVVHRDGKKHPDDLHEGNLLPCGPIAKTHFDAISFQENPTYEMLIVLWDMDKKLSQYGVSLTAEQCKEIVAKIAQPANS